MRYRPPSALTAWRMAADVAPFLCPLCGEKKACKESLSPAGVHVLALVAVVRLSVTTKPVEECRSRGGDGGGGGKTSVLFCGGCRTVIVRTKQTLLGLMGQVVQVTREQIGPKNKIRQCVDVCVWPVCTDNASALTSRRLVCRVRVSPEKRTECIQELEADLVVERSRPLLQQVLERSDQGHSQLQRYSGVSALCLRPKGSDRAWACRRRFVQHITDGIADEICGSGGASPGRLPRGVVSRTMSEH